MQIRNSMQNRKAGARTERSFRWTVCCAALAIILQQLYPSAQLAAAQITAGQSEPNASPQTPTIRPAAETTRPDNMNQAPITRQSPQKLSRSTPGAAAVQPNAGDVKPRNGGPFTVNGPTTRIGRQLWRAQITSRADNGNSKSKDELRRLIEQVRSVQFKTHAETNEQPLRKPGPTAEPNETTTRPDTAAELNTANTRPEPNTPYISNRTMQMLREQLKENQQFRHPFDLAEIMFRTGNLEEAAECYRKALAMTDPNSTQSATERAWILFQMGNCLSRHEPAKAIQEYRSLIEQYPESIWVDLAKARSRMLEWYEQNKPETWINANQQQQAEDPQKP